jgi:hypothetical protein
LYHQLKERGANAAKNQSAFLAYPLLQNDIANTDLTYANDILSTNGTEEEDKETRVMCLVLQNKGKRDAMNVQLNVERLTLNGIVDVEEVSGGGGEDYEPKIRQKTSGSSEAAFRVPFSLETGSGVLVPLFITRHPFRASYTGTRSHEWRLVSKIAYLPKSITFNDVLNQQPIRIEVRKMRDPVRLDNGVEVRG